MKAHDKIQGKLDAQMADDMAYSTKDSIFSKKGKKAIFCRSIALM
jgi:hypothetical protein